MTKKLVYIEPTWKLHVGYHVKELLPYPPEGYQFVTAGRLGERLYDGLSRISGVTRAMYATADVIPLFLLKSLADRMTARKPPAGTSLTYSCHHIVFRSEPWILEIGRIWELVGHNPRHFRLLKPLVEHVLQSDNCKKVLCFTEFSRKTCLSVLSFDGMAEKIDVLPRAVHPKTFRKSRVDGPVQILFVGSANLAGTFEDRGGKEVLEAFEILTARYPSVRLVIRSEIPAHIYQRYGRILRDPRVEIIDGQVPWDKMDEIYRSSDLFLFPCHYESWQIILEAMSYELPVIAIDHEGVSEFLRDGETGFVVKESDNFRWEQGGLAWGNALRAARRSLKQTDARVVRDLVTFTSALVEDPVLRRAMGEAGRALVEVGDYSIRRRNEKLREVFDSALDGEEHLAKS